MQHPVEEGGMTGVDHGDITAAVTQVRRVLEENKMLDEPGCWVEPEMYVHFDDRSHTLHPVWEKKARELAKSGVGWVHQPDVLVHFADTHRRVASRLDVGGGITWVSFRALDWLIVEVDGSVHDTKVKGTVERNRDYERAGISHIVINKTDAENCRLDWEDELHGAVEDHIGVMVE